MKRRGIGTSRLLVVLATAVPRLAARRRVLVLGVSQVLSHLHQEGHADPAMAALTPVLGSTVDSWPVPEWARSTT